MRHAAIYFSQQVNARLQGGEMWDVLFCTDMLNLAEFKGMVGQSVTRVPSLVYFHENQFEYPNRYEKQRDKHFPFTNFVSCHTADVVWFNSDFNKRTFFEGLEKESKNWPDFVPRLAIDSLDQKSLIEPPLIEFPELDIRFCLERKAKRRIERQPIRLVWAARWEHDKNPQALLATLEALADCKLDFRISVIGQAFRKIPKPIQQIKQNFADRILSWGFIESRQDYWKVLADADCFLSTANHEFFGLSAAEAIAAGCHVLLPNRLSYPELLTYGFVDDQQIQSRLYDGTTEDLVNRIQSLAHQSSDTDGLLDGATRIKKRLDIRSRARQLDLGLARLVQRTATK